MSDIVDARGLSCPQPVILTMQKIKQTPAGEFSVLVDTETSKENVCRAAKSKGWLLRETTTEGDEFRLTFTKE